MSPGLPGRAAAAGTRRHDLAVVSTLTWADTAAKAGDHARAVGWLRVIEAIGDELPREYQTKRREWLEAVGACSRVGRRATPVEDVIESAEDAAPACEPQQVAAPALEASLEDLLEAGRHLVGARYAALGVLDRRRQGLEHFIATGLDERAHRQIGGPPRGRGMLGLLIVDPRPLRIDDVADDARHYGFPPGHPMMHSFLGVPIMIDGVPWGNLYVAEKSGGVFDEADEEAAVLLAARAAVIVEQSRSATSRAC
jgi:transcriptional regulator with GAF, ATPase, and Fis domain